MSVLSRFWNQRCGTLSKQAPPHGELTVRWTRWRGCAYTHLLPAECTFLPFAYNLQLRVSLSQAVTCAFKFHCRTLIVPLLLILYFSLGPRLTHAVRIRSNWFDIDSDPNFILYCNHTWVYNERLKRIFCIMPVNKK
jgi:hypothetical protein